MPRKAAVGVVTSDKMAKTRRVEIARLVKHTMYGKYVRRKTICYVHDENNESALGDKVEIIESRPRSKMKRWDLVRVIEKSTAVDVAALRAAARQQVETEGEGQGDR
jgi:small subunit ribosomal protein S17